MCIGNGQHSINTVTICLVYSVQDTVNAESQLTESITNKGSLKATNGERLVLNFGNRWLYCSLLYFIIRRL
jgi:hypothetical protein